MTRDEAIAKAKTAYLAAGGHCSEASFGASIDTYIALGMLNLNDGKIARPVSAEARAYVLLDEEGHHASQILGILKADGLQIIKKGQ